MKPIEKRNFVSRRVLCERSVRHDVDIEYDPTSVIPSVAALSCSGYKDPRLVHNNGFYVDSNMYTDPVAIAGVADDFKNKLSDYVNTVSGEIDHVEEPVETDQPLE